MSKARMEAFSDGVLAIIITIMVLELKIPHGIELAALRPLIPVFLSYGLSFIYLGIYWSNHHHLLYAAHSVNGAILWANLHLLFWLSLVPFVTGWMGENRLAPAPTAVYGVILLLAAIAYLLLQHAILREEGPGSALRAALGSDWKGKISPLIYAIAIPVAFLRPWISGALYVVCAVLWLVPDRRIERTISPAGREIGTVGAGVNDRVAGEVDA
jgi:TMEM175 potassium channel family protein